MGSNARREYAAIGGPVNMAARFMGMHRGNVIVDKYSMEDAKESFKFEFLGSVTLKGIKDPVEIYAPIDNDEDSRAKAAYGPLVSTEL